MAFIGTYLAFVANRDIDNEIVAITLPYLFNPSMFYWHKKISNPSFKSLSGYYEYNTHPTLKFIEKFNEIQRNLLEIVDGHYAITFSCDSNNLYFVFRVILSPVNSPRMCKEVFKYLISIGLMPYANPRIIFYDDYYRKHDNLPEIKFIVATGSIDSRLLNITGKNILDRQYGARHEAPHIFICDNYPEVYAGELSRIHAIDSFVGGRDHLLIDARDLDRFNAIDLSKFKSEVAALIEELIASGDIVKYVRYGMVLLNGSILTETVLTPDLFESKTPGTMSTKLAPTKDLPSADKIGDSNSDGDKNKDKNGGDCDNCGDCNKCNNTDSYSGGDYEGRNGGIDESYMYIPSEPSTYPNTHMVPAGEIFGGNNQQANRYARPKPQSTGPKAPIKQSKYNPCDISLAPADKNNGDRGSIKNKDAPLLHHVDDTGFHRQGELPVEPKMFEYAPNPETIRILLEYIGMTQADFEKLDKDKQTGVFDSFLRRNPHLFQIFCNDGKYTLYKSPGKLQIELTDATPWSTYRRRECEVKSVNHWGQRKLLMTEIFFLIECGHLASNAIYVGAAPGHHTLLLMKMFPHITVHMYDTQPFAMRPNAQFVQFVEYFTDEHAERYEEDDKEWLFICDIRGFRKFNEKFVNSSHENESVIAEDMIDQEAWAYMIKPAASFIKFRLGWDDKKTRYMNGRVITQLWEGSSSTEMRLLSLRQPDGKMPPRRFYSNKLYEDQCFKHNTEIRAGIYKPFESLDVKFTVAPGTAHPSALATSIISASDPILVQPASTPINKLPAPLPILPAQLPTQGGAKRRQKKNIGGESDDVSFSPFFDCCYDCVGEIELLAAYLDSPFGARVAHNLLRKPGEPLIESALFIEALAARQSEAPASQTQFLTELISSPDWNDESYARTIAFIYEEASTYEGAEFAETLANAVKDKIAPSTKTKALLDAVTTAAGDSNAADFAKLLSLISAVATQVRTAPQVKSPEVAAIDFKTANPASRDLIIKLAARISYFLNLHETQMTRRLDTVAFGDSKFIKFTKPMVLETYIV